MSRIATLSYEEAREIAARVKETRDVIRLQRIGASPFLRFTPYENHRGTTVNMWSCVTVSFEAMPERTLIGMPKIVRPWTNDDWEINQIHTPWVVARLMEMPPSKVTVLPADETPFAGEMLRWDIDADEDGGSE
jgi:hypothetical protein